MNINLKSSSITEISKFKSNLYGKTISKMSTGDMCELYKLLYNDNYHKDINDLGKIQIRNRLVERLNITIIEKEIEEKTGINREWIDSFVKEALSEVAKDKRINSISSKDYGFSIKFWQSWGMSDLIEAYISYYKKDKNRFDYEVEKIFDKDKIISFETSSILGKVT